MLYGLKAQIVPIHHSLFNRQEGPVLPSRRSQGKRPITSQVAAAHGCAEAWNLHGQLKLPASVGMCDVRLFSDIAASTGDQQPSVS